VRVAANKLRAFRTLGEAGVAIPRFTRLADAAHEWDTDVMIRELLNSHSGRGMRFVPREDRSSLLGTTAPLYVEYIKKLMEYRVHVMGGKVIDVQQKRVREGSTGNDFQIRSYNNGWVFCRNGIDLPPDVSPLAVDAVRALRLDFGAVDIIYNALRQKSYVLEVNTAPGLHGSTIEIYANAIQEML
jgi:glutathione synthase/RimK-type ligase-like ATP-grasp enzyme